MSEASNFAAGCVVTVMLTGGGEIATRVLTPDQARAMAKVLGTLADAAEAQGAPNPHEALRATEARHGDILRLLLSAEAEEHAFKMATAPAAAPIGGVS